MPTPYSVEFFAKHQSKPAIIQAHDQAQEHWCRNAQQLMEHGVASASVNQEDQLRRLIVELGSRQLGLHESMEGRQREFHNELGSSVRDQVTSQVSALLVGIDSAANALFHRLDTDRLSNSIANDVAAKQSMYMAQFKGDVVETLRAAVAGPVGDAMRGVGATLSAASATHQGVQQVHEDVRQVQAKLDGLDKQLTRNAMHTRTIGSSNENRLFNLLTDRLMQRDGYRIEQVNGQAHSCDIQIEKIDAPTVRIEVKAHGERSGEKVRYKEVERFRDDLIRLNEHGIMVSLYSGIVSVGAIEVEQLPNGKFAAFLANNNFDVDVIINMLHLMYKLDSIVVSAEDADTNDGTTNHIRVPTDAMVRIRTYVKDYTKRLQSAKVHLRETITILNDIQMDVIEKVLMDCGVNTAVAEGSDESGVAPALQCEHCRHTFSGKHAAKSLYNHMRNSKKCKARRTGANEIMPAALSVVDEDSIDRETNDEPVTPSGVVSMEESSDHSSDDSDESDGSDGK